jgi:hypothetical protein
MENIKHADFPLCYGMRRLSPVNWLPFVFCLCILLCNMSPVFSQIRKIRIDPLETHQEIENFTASDAWSGNFVGKYWDEKQKRQIAKWCLLPGLKPPMDGFAPEWEPANYAGMQPALLLGRLVYGDFVYAGSRAWGYWKGMEVNGNHALVSLYPTDGDLLKGGLIHTNKMLWALGNYSFFIRPGYKRIGLWGADDLDTLVASAYMAPDKSRIVAVFINSSFERIPVSVSFLNGYDKKVKKVSVFRTDERSDLANMYVSEEFSSDTKYEIPPRALITMVLYF